MEDWTEKYRPKSLDEIVANDKAIYALKSWANKWNSGKIPSKRAVILSGKAGIGKTSSAIALANDFNWTHIELNASDARNASAIKRIATSGALNETFDINGNFLSKQRGGRKLIILDEADNLYEKTEKNKDEKDFGDRGGKKAIIDTIKHSGQPIILVVNDYYSLVKGSGIALKQICSVIQFYEVSSSQIVDLLKRICKEEEIFADIKSLKIIADRCKGDVRSAVNDLQSLCINKKQLDPEAVNVLGYRDREKIIFDSVGDVFKGRNLKIIKDNIQNIDVPPETFLLWLNENLPREYLDTNDMIKGFDALSKADLFFGRVFKRQYYGLWSYACDIMSGGVSTAKSHNYGNIRYFSPTWIRIMKDSKSSRITRDSIIRKIGILCHNSEKKSREFLPVFKHLFSNNLRFACKISNKIELTELEIKYLLGEEKFHKMKEIMQCSEISDEKQTEIKVEKKEIKEEKQEKQEIKQPSIFDF